MCSLRSPRPIRSDQSVLYQWLCASPGSRSHQLDGRPAFTAHRDLVAHSKRIFNVFRRQEGEATADLRPGIIDGAPAVRIERAYPAASDAQLVEPEAARFIDRKKAVFFNEPFRGQVLVTGCPGDVFHSEGDGCLMAALPAASALEGPLKGFQVLDSPKDEIVYF